MYTYITTCSNYSKWLYMYEYTSYGMAVRDLYNECCMLLFVTHENYLSWNNELN